MSASEYIRQLLRRFPGLKPKAIRRLCKINGFNVDTNLVNVTRHRDLALKRFYAVNRVLSEFNKRHGHILLRAANHDEYTKLAGDLVDKHPDKTPDEVGELLEAEYAKGNVPVAIDPDLPRRLSRLAAQ